MVAVGDWHALAGPLRSTGDLGARVLTIARRHSQFTCDEREIFAQMCVQAGIALENVELHDRLRRQAATDELTGLANHRRFQEQLAEHVERAGPNGPWLGLLLIDIDDFKAVNDTHGHQAGDLVLRDVARVLFDSVRGTDMPARYGGEELAVILPRTDAAGAAEVAGQIRRAIEEQVVVLPSGRAVSLTVSIGAAGIPASASNPTDLIAAADAALYRAKRAGKNRFASAPAQRRLPAREPAGVSA
jgi:diguanylate cyclase (GGDEF)-like protein